MYNLTGNDYDYLLFNLQTELKQLTRERVEVKKANGTIQIVIAFHWILDIPMDEMEDLLDSVGEPKGILKDSFEKYKELYMRRRP